MAEDNRGRLFGSVADLYDEYRPGYPDGALVLFGDLAGREVVELGAGTGKLTRFLVDHGARVTAVEPDPEMRRVLTGHLPGIAVLASSAEQVDLPDASADLVVSSSVWHWLAQPAAERECARLLRDGGRLLVLWNGLSLDVDWARGLTALRERPVDPARRSRQRRATLEAGGPFDDVRDVDYPYQWTRTEDEVVQLFFTFSETLVSTDEERRALEVGLRARFRELSGGRATLEVPMLIRGTAARRVAR